MTGWMEEDSFQAISTNSNVFHIQAITEDLREFDDELFKRLFSPDSVKPPQVSSNTSNESLDPLKGQVTDFAVALIISQAQKRTLFYQ